MRWRRPPAQCQGWKTGTALERQDVQPLVLQLLAKTRLAVGDVNAFDDLAGGRPEPTAEFHRPSVAYGGNSPGQSRALAT